MKIPFKKNLLETHRITWIICTCILTSPKTYIIYCKTEQEAIYFYNKTIELANVFRGINKDIREHTLEIIFENGGKILYDYPQNRYDIRRMKNNFAGYNIEWITEEDFGESIRRKRSDEYMKKFFK